MLRIRKSLAALAGLGALALLTGCVATGPGYYDDGGYAQPAPYYGGGGYYADPVVVAPPVVLGIGVDSGPSYYRGRPGNYGPAYRGRPGWDGRPGPSVRPHPGVRPGPGAWQGRPGRAPGAVVPVVPRPSQQRPGPSRGKSGESPTKEYDFR